MSGAGTFPSVGHLLLAAVLAAAVAGAARAARALSPSGALAAAFVGFCLYGFGGGKGAAALLLFFVTSSALSRLGKRRKDALAFEKGGERDAGQVLANGGVAALCALLLPFASSPWPVAALLGALAAANADTWATELGALARRPPVMVTTLRPAPTGASGAVSFPGTCAAMAGAALLGCMALPWGMGWDEVVLITLSGFHGSFFDSLLGATVQAQYRCPRCGKLTERRVHCEGETGEGVATVLERGLPWMNNDVVNALATLFGAVLAGGLLGLSEAR